jgi:crotonobetainyl-CoA:carnitine CoA-transferase CaiB-like acyl-CoA transferase
MDELSTDDRFSTNPARSVHRDQLRSLLAPALEKIDGRNLVDELIEAGVPCAPICSVQDVLLAPHSRHMKLTVALENGYKGIASPIMMSDTPPTYRMAPPAQNTEIAHEL